MPKTFTPFFLRRSQKFQYVCGKFGEIKIKFIASILPKTQIFCKSGFWACVATSCYRVFICSHCSHFIASRWLAYFSTENHKNSRPFVCGEIIELVAHTTYAKFEWHILFVKAIFLLENQFQCRYNHIAIFRFATMSQVEEICFHFCCR